MGVGERCAHRHLHTPAKGIVIYLVALKSLFQTTKGMSDLVHLKLLYTEYPIRCYLGTPAGGELGDEMHCIATESNFVSSADYEPNFVCNINLKRAIPSDGALPLFQPRSYVNSAWFHDQVRKESAIGQIRVAQRTVGLSRVRRPDDHDLYEHFHHHRQRKLLNRLN
jgi:hypothetical protein